MSILLTQKQIQMSKKNSKTTICSFCLNDFTKDRIWWVDLKMHRDDPKCTSLYSTASCEKCKDDPENSWMIVGISEEPKPKKSKNKESQEIFQKILDILF